MEYTHHITAIRSWRKSSRSFGGDSNCVEVGIAETTVGVRDSKLTAHEECPVLVVSTTDWNGVIEFVGTSRPIV